MFGYFKALKAPLNEGWGVPETWLSVDLRIWETPYKSEKAFLIILISYLEEDIHYS